MNNSTLEQTQYNTAKADSTRNNKAKVEKRTHWFSNEVAKLTGSKAAIILCCLARLQKKHGKLVAGKIINRVTLRQIAQWYPYLSNSKSSVETAINKLAEHGIIEITSLQDATTRHRINKELGRAKYDRKLCIHIPDKWMKEAEFRIASEKSGGEQWERTNQRFFEVALASTLRETVSAEVAIAGAVIHRNFTCMLQWKKTSVWKLKPAELKKIQAFKEDTIKRAIKALVDRGFISPLGEPTENRLCYYRLRDKSPRLKAELLDNEPQISVLDQTSIGARSDKLGVNRVLDQTTIILEIKNNIERDSKKSAPTARMLFEQEKEESINPNHSIALDSARLRSPLERSTASLNDSTPVYLYSNLNNNDTVTVTTSTPKKLSILELAIREWESARANKIVK